MYTQELTLNNPQVLICHKTKLRNQLKFAWGLEFLGWLFEKWFQIGKELKEMSLLDLGVSTWWNKNYLLKDNF